MSNTKLVEGLNEKQHLAVTAKSGYTLVLAGAGSGKTKVLVSRIAWLIENAALTPSEILAVTFTNKAAKEMKERLHNLLNISLYDLWMGTFHGLCHKLLRKHATELGMSNNFQILDQDDQARLIKRIMNDLNLDLDKFPVKSAQSFINNRKDEGYRSNAPVANSYGSVRVWAQVYEAYETLCKTNSLVDFGELMLLTYELFKNNAELRTHYQNKFKAVLVDEFQDTNTIQYAWLKLLMNDKTSVTIVGDDDQSIYGWRGAKVENIQRFTDEYKSTEIIRLEQNYRSTSVILNAANALISNNKRRMGKNLWTAGHDGEKITLYSALNEFDESRFIIQKIKTLFQKGYTAKDMAVLYRSNAQSRVLEEGFLRANIAYQIYGGMRFYERAEIKDTLAYLRLLLNFNDDNAFDRIINFPARGIGDKSLELIKELSRRAQCSYWDSTKFVISKAELPARAITALNNFVLMMESLQQKILVLPLEQQIALIIQESGLHAHFSKEPGEVAATKLENLQELMNAVAQFRVDNADTNATASEFLAHVSLEAPEAPRGMSESCVQMMTLHAAKGLEFPIVFMAGVEEGLFPSHQSTDDLQRLEEERRLCYVGMTRAKALLFLSYARFRRQYGREESHKPSRFLREIPEKFVDNIVENAAAFTPNNNFTKAKFESVDFEDSMPYKKNQVVRHPTFGEGVVLALEGSGASQRIQIKFKSSGVKWLVLSYAKLC